MDTSPAASPPSEAWAEQFAALLCAQRARASDFLAAHQTRLEQIETVVEQELNRLEEELLEEYSEVDRLRAEHDAVSAQLHDAEAKLAESQKNVADRLSHEGSPEEDEDNRRRYEMALDDIRQLKNKNTELQQQLAKARSTAAKLAQQSRQPGTLNWEAEKQRILAALEADSDDTDSARREERLKIEEIVRATDEIIAAKNREIEDLKRQLEERHVGAKSRTPQAVPAEKPIDTDTLIREERERLSRLQDEWREKLRQAEVDLSLERAKLARQRAELEEQFRSGSKSPTESSEVVSEDENHPDQSPGSRWLARLGLTTADREPPRHP